MEDAEAHIVVSGLVQGVGYRFFVQREAWRRGLTGFVKNLGDGRVEVRARGDKGVILDLSAELRRGPRMSRVTNVELRWVEPQGEFSGFEIGF